MDSALEGGGGLADAKPWPMQVLTPMDSAPDASVHVLLRRVQARLTARESPGHHPPHGELMCIIERLEALDDDGRAQIERAAMTLRGALAAVASAVDVNDELAREHRLLLRRTTRTLTAMIEQAQGDNSSTRITAEDLVLSYGRCDLSAMLIKSFAPFERLAQARELHWMVDAPSVLPAEVDVRVLQWVFVSLLFHSLKFTPRRGTVRIVLEHDEANDEVVLTLEDSGPAIFTPHPARHRQPCDRASLFEGGGLADVAGAGVELPRARALVALHGGTLTVTRSRLGGPCFRVHVPRGAPNSLLARAPHGTPYADIEDTLAQQLALRAQGELNEEETLEHRVPAEGQRPLVLVVEGSRWVQRLLIHELAPGCATASALDGADGLRRIFDLRPDVVVMSGHQTGLAGLEVLHAVRRRPELAGVSVLMLGTRSDARTADTLFAAGVQDVLLEPHHPAEIRARVHHLVDQGRAFEALRALVPEEKGDLGHAVATVAHEQHALKRALAQAESGCAQFERASATKSLFIRMMAHELRTPITAMHLHVHLLEQEATVRASPVLSQGLARIHATSQRLVQLINTMLEWARVESNRVTLTLEELDLEAIAREVARGHAELAARRKLTLVVEPATGPREVPLISDRRLVSLIAMNLVARAVHITQQGTVGIRVESSRTGHALSIRDGAPHPSTPGLGDSAAGAATTGVAGDFSLFVVHDLARAVEADVVVEPMDDAGTTVTVRFPSLPPSRAS